MTVRLGAALAAGMLPLISLAGCGSSDSDGSSADAAPAADDGISAGAAQSPGPSAAAPPGGDQHAGDPLYDTEAHRLITAAMAGKKFIRCTATDTDDTVTAYVHGEKKMRIDGGTGPDAGHLLAVGGVTYLWSDDQPGGMKTTGPATDGMRKMIEGMGVNLDAARSMGGEQAAGIDENATLGCSEYDGDESVFQVPEGREFTSVDDALGQAPLDFPGQVPGTGGN